MFLHSLPRLKSTKKQLPNDMISTQPDHIVNKITKYLYDKSLVSLPNTSKYMKKMQKLVQKARELKKWNSFIKKKYTITKVI
jgi:hypothetical protein